MLLRTTLHTFFIVGHKNGYKKMKTKGSCKFCRQTAGIGAFAEVVLSIQKTDEPLSVSFSKRYDWKDKTVTDGMDDFDDAMMFKETIEYGIYYGWQLVSYACSEKYGLESIEVKVDHIGAYWSDTTHATMLYAAMNALWDALEVFPEERPEIDVVKGFLQLPLIH